MQVMFGGAMGELQALLEPRSPGTRGRGPLERTIYPAGDVALVDVLCPGGRQGGHHAFLQDCWGLEALATLAIGDDWNDRQMLLEAAGWGLVMGNADRGLRALGFGVLPSNDEEGVAHALETHVLGDLGAGQPQQKWGARATLDPPNVPGALTSSSSKPSSWQPSSSPALR